MKVLHVTECFAGGVSTSLIEYVKNTPELDHHLLFDDRGGLHTHSEESFLGFKTVERLPTGYLRATRKVRKWVLRQNPDVVHAHSTFAGVFVRLSVLNRKNRRIIYTPHGFSFERRDKSLVSRLVYLLIELLLGINTDLVAACSVREQKLAKRLMIKSIYIPNVPALRIASNFNSEIREGTFRIVAAGRVTEARGIDFFLELVRIANELEASFTFTWVGDGNPALVSKLRLAGVRLTGWLSGNEVHEEFVRSNVYVHTAAWDGFPMTVLEANEAGLPIIVRKIPVFRDFPQDWVATNPTEMYELIKQVSNQSGSQFQAFENTKIWNKALSLNNPTFQTMKLREAYGC